MYITQVMLMLFFNWNEFHHAVYDWTPTEPGTYTIGIYSKMDNDCKCEGSNLKFQEIEIVVVEGDNEVPEFGLVGTALVGLGLFGFAAFKRKQD